MATFPSTVKNTEEALNYLLGAVQGVGQRIISLVTSGATTLAATAAQVLSGMFYLTGGTTCALTLPTAAAVVAAIGSAAAVGSTFQFEVLNNNSGTATLTTNTGNTIVGTATIATTKGQIVRGIVTNATSGAEAVSYYVIGSAGF